MAGTKLHDLTAGSALVGTEEFYGVKSPFGSGDDRKWTANQIKTFTGGGSPVVANTLTSGATGVLIPGYVYPNNPYSDTAFLNLLDTIRKYHRVPVIYVVNPGNGPGASVDGNYTGAIRLLRAAGALVIGYVSTDYATR